MFEKVGRVISYKSPLLFFSSDATTRAPSRARVDASERRRARTGDARRRRRRGTPRVAAAPLRASAANRAFFGDVLSRSRHERTRRRARLAAAIAPPAPRDRGDAPRARRRGGRRGGHRAAARPRARARPPDEDVVLVVTADDVRGVTAARNAGRDAFDLAPAPGPAPALDCSTIEGVAGGMPGVDLFYERACADPPGFVYMPSLERPESERNARVAAASSARVLGVFISVFPRSALRRFSRGRR